MQTEHRQACPFLALVLVAGCWMLNTSVSATEGPQPRQPEARTRTSAAGDPAVATATSVWEAIQDGGFELGSPNPYWDETSLNYARVIQTYHPRTGSYACWFGGDTYYDEIGSVEQTVQLGTESATLVFWLRIGEYSGNGSDRLLVMLDGVQVFIVHEAQHSLFEVYTRVALNLSDFADGHNHTIRFESHTAGYYGTKTRQVSTSFDLDDVSLVTGDATLNASFVIEPIRPLVGEQVSFRDTSGGEPTAWLWDLGDGTTSSHRNVVHTYQEAGTYTVRLTVTNAAQQRSSAMQELTVSEPVTADFEWLPPSPESGEETTFLDRSTGTPTAWTWSFGEGSSSNEQNPVHRYDEPGTYLVRLTASNELSSDSVERQVTVAPPSPDIGFTVSDANPERGEEVIFTIIGVDAVQRADWDFGGDGCLGFPRTVSCTPDKAKTGDCLSHTHRYSAHGAKTVTLTMVVAGETLDPVTRPVTVASWGRCPGAPLASFTYFPRTIRLETPVRFVDTSEGDPSRWAWSFGDNTTSTGQHAQHRYQTPGTYQVILGAWNEAGYNATSQSLVVEPGAAPCGDGVCEVSESWFTCRDDCAPPEGSTGRAGRAGKLLYVPVVVGGVPGTADTFWLTEGTVFNTTQSTALCLFELSPDEDLTSTLWTDPLLLPPRTSRSYQNLVLDLFDVTGSGSLWLFCDQAVMLDTRTYNQTDNGTFGQAIPAISSDSFLSEGSGVFYLIGLSENDRFRSNLVVQEVTGRTVQVDLQGWGADGSLLGSGSIWVPGHSKVQRRLRNLGLGFHNISNGYLTLRVNGNGSIVALSSVIDQLTGDATTGDAVHPSQVLSVAIGKDRTPGSRTPGGRTPGGRTPGGRTPGGSNPDSIAIAQEGHFLVAVVARAPGLNQSLWRSSVTIQNPSGRGQEVRLEYYPGADPINSSLVLQPGELFSTEDLIGEHFTAAGDGAGSLHIFAHDGVIVSSRTYNLLPSGGTMGQSLPGLGSGDMARYGQTWVLNKLKSTNEFRCNIGFAEYEGRDTEVVVVLFDMSGNSRRFLASRTYQVPARSNLQINGIFDAMGLTAEYEEAMAYTAVTTQGGALYVYASVVDNNQGDASTVLAKMR